MTLGRQEHEGCGLGCEAEAWAPGQHLVWVGRCAPRACASHACAQGSHPCGACAAGSPSIHRCRYFSHACVSWATCMWRSITPMRTPTASHQLHMHVAHRHMDVTPTGRPRHRPVGLSGHPSDFYRLLATLRLLEAEFIIILRLSEVKRCVGLAAASDPHHAPARGGARR